jgi:hypothetical protein
MTVTAKGEDYFHDAPVGPYLRWAVATRFSYLGGEAISQYPVLLSLTMSAAEFWTGVDRLGTQDLIRVPAIYRRPPRDIDSRALTFCTAVMQRSVIEGLVDDRTQPEIAMQLKALLKKAELIELGAPVVPFVTSRPLAEREEARGPARPVAPRTIVAIIDDGLAFANERFRDSAGGTRFKYFWNQDDVTSIGPPPDYGATPPGFGWGLELGESDINALLTACRHAGLVDEDELYRRAGQRLVARRAKHGTHVMDLACGDDPQRVNHRSPYLIGVQLPRSVTRETSGGLLTPVVLDALAYILDRADQIALAENTAPLPVVVNLSYGTIAGPHDGTAQLEQVIDQLVAARATPLRVVLPAGNHHLARCHASLRLAKASPAAPVHAEPLSWRVQPDNLSPSLMEIWLPHSAPAQPLPQVEFSIAAPGGPDSPWIGPGGTWSWPAPDDACVLAWYFDQFPAWGRPMILLALAPTVQPPPPSPRPAPAGTWQVKLRNLGRTITVDAWIQRGDTPFGYPLRGRQSRFDDPRYVRFDPQGRPQTEDSPGALIVRRDTVNALATGHEVVVVGGFRRSDYAASRYSGAGPVIVPPAVPFWRDGPDVTAASDDSPVLRGVLAAGTRTGSVVAMDGTSVAAPQVTRLIADWMTTGLPSDRATLRAFAEANDPAGPLPPERGGAGRIDTPPLVTRWVKW